MANFIKYYIKCRSLLNSVKLNHFQSSKKYELLFKATLISYVRGQSRRIPGLFGENNKQLQLERSNYNEFDEDLFYLLSEGGIKASLFRFVNGIRQCGLWLNDPRLAEVMTKIKALQSNNSAGEDILIDRSQLKDLIKDNVVLIRQAFINDMIIPDFYSFCASVEDIYWACRKNISGKILDNYNNVHSINQSYSKSMTKNIEPEEMLDDEEQWAVSICTIDGQRFSLGNVKQLVALGSCCKPINYAFATDEHGENVANQFVSHEPDLGTNVQFEDPFLSSKIPRNPLTTAGALVITSLLESGQNLDKGENCFNQIKKKYKSLCGGGPINFNEKCFKHRHEQGDTARALGYHLRQSKCLPAGIDLNSTIELFFRLCSLETDTDSGAVMAATLANGGLCPLTDEPVIKSESSVRNTLSLMHSCGLSHKSGNFAFKAGLPIKGSLYGVMLLVVPNLMGVCLWSPLVDSESQMSSRGLQFCERLSSEFDLHHFSCRYRQKNLNYPGVLSKHEDSASRTIKLLLAASQGDLPTLRIFYFSGHDMNSSDYDGRTALHLASSEGKLDCVKFLVEKCKSNFNLVDRWGLTALDDAKRENHLNVAEYLNKLILKKLIVNK